MLINLLFFVILNSFNFILFALCFLLQNGYKLGGSPAESPFGISSEAARLWQGSATATPRDRPDTGNVSLEDVMMVFKFHNNLHADD